MGDTEYSEADFLYALGSEVRAWRARRGLTRAELASRVGISVSTLGRIERSSGVASATVADVWRIAREVGIGLADLVRRAEEAAALAASAPPRPDARVASIRPEDEVRGLRAVAHHDDTSIFDEQGQAGG
ncbi:MULTISPECIES: helix-turn-helix domain-containing protein [unclassified Isoptericola]|uniref:helix-turn-helix domain-containing protein n=1 Tax=Isoptericola sp. NPDC057191 TaxID=3346041 RepID=UPI0036362165